MGSNSLPVKKNIDSKFRRPDSVSSSNFRLDLPYTLKLPDNAIFFVDDVAIPHNWYTVETGVNDKLYFRLQLANGGSIMDRIIILDAGTYAPTVFKDHLKNKVSAAASGVATTTAYDTSTNILSISVANLDIIFFTDKELKELTSVTWNGLLTAQVIFPVPTI